MLIIQWIAMSLIVCVCKLAVKTEVSLWFWTTKSRLDQRSVYFIQFFGKKRVGHLGTANVVGSRSRDMLSHPSVPTNPVTSPWVTAEWFAAVPLPLVFDVSPPLPVPGRTAPWLGVAARRSCAVAYWSVCCEGSPQGWVCAVGFWVMEKKSSDWDLC